MIEPLKLDNRTYADFIEEARAVIPSLTPEWTDHNPTDPGIALLELFAWLAEMVLYRIDRVPESSYRTFLRLLRGPAAPPANGTTPAALDQAIRETVAELRKQHRAITSDDFESLATGSWSELEDASLVGLRRTVRRARCFAEQSPVTLVKAGERAEGHYTLVIVGDCLSAERNDLPAFDPARRDVLELDGKAGYVDCGSDSSLAITGALTLSAWIFPRSVSARQALVGKEGAGEYELTLEPGGALTFRQRDGMVGGTSNTRISAGRWSHVAAARDAGGRTVRFYIDGKLAGEAPLAGPPVPSAAPVLLGRSPGGGNFFDGFLRDVAVWDVERSASDLAGDLRRPPPGVDSGAHGAALRPVACWRLDSAADGRIARDAETTLSSPRLRDGRLLPATDSSAAAFRDAVRPIPASAALLSGLHRFLDEWRLLTTKVHVLDHRPVSITIRANLYLRSDGVPSEVRKHAQNALTALLDPLTGWEGEGWPFGRSIFVSDAQAALDKLPGVDFVGESAIGLAAAGQTDRPPIPLDDHGTPMGVALHPHELPDLSSVELLLYRRIGTKWEPT